MLDYMKNNENNENNEINEESSMSLQEALSDNDEILNDNDQDYDGEGGDQEFLTTSVEKTSVKRSTTILVALFVIGAVSIFLMVKNATPSTVAAAQTGGGQSEIELAIAKLSGIKAEIFAKMDGIARKFDELSNIEQIEVEHLQRNPFSLQTAVSSRIGGSGLSGSRLSNTYFELDSIIQSDEGNMCMIDGQIYREGDMIGGYVIERVERDQVVMGINGDVKILKIDVQ